MAFIDDEKINSKWWYWSIQRNMEFILFQKWLFPVSPISAAIVSMTKATGDCINSHSKRNWCRPNVKADVLAEVSVIMSTHIIRRRLHWWAMCAGLKLKWQCVEHIVPYSYFIIAIWWVFQQQPWYWKMEIGRCSTWSRRMTRTDESLFNHSWEALQFDFLCAIFSITFRSNHSFSSINSNRITYAVYARMSIHRTHAHTAIKHKALHSTLFDGCENEIQLNWYFAVQTYWSA